MQAFIVFSLPIFLVCQTNSGVHGNADSGLYNVSFPSILTDEVLEPFGYAILHDVPQPEYDIG